jgi:serpin B
VQKSSVRIGAVLAAAVLLLAACGRADPPGDAGRIDAHLVAQLAPGDAAAVGKAVDAFGFDLFARTADGKRNTITSPLSAAALLAMVLAGADGDTATQLAKVLHLSDRRDVRVGALLRKLADTDEVTLSVADSLWAGQGAPLRQDYLDYVRKTFGATAEQGDLASPATARRIDEWASGNTGGRIPTIAADLGLPSPDAVLVLLNAVYFLGEWTTPFDPARTTPDPFAVPGGGRVTVPTMHLSDAKFSYAQRPGYRMLRLPYGKHGRYAMEIMLPDQGTALTRMIGGLDAAEWTAALAALHEQPIENLALPRFELRWKGELTDSLRKLGLTTAFGPGAGFGSMSAASPFLSTVVQKTYVRVDEKGTEAAAVTGGVMATSAIAGGTSFVVDRPFAFAISDQQTGAILFLGAVSDPRG